VDLPSPDRQPAIWLTPLPKGGNPQGRGGQGATLFLTECLGHQEVGLVTVLVTVRSRFWSRSHIYQNRNQSPSERTIRHSWHGDSRSPSFSVSSGRNSLISPFKARALDSSPRRLPFSLERRSSYSGVGKFCVPCLVVGVLRIVLRPSAFLFHMYLRRSAQSLGDPVRNFATDPGVACSVLIV
jgi:hypothetical protein